MERLRSVSQCELDKGGRLKSQSICNVVDLAPSYISVSSGSVESSRASVLSDSVAGRKRRNNNMCSIKSGKRTKKENKVSVLKQKDSHPIAVSIDESKNLVNDNFQPGIFL